MAYESAAECQGQCGVFRLGSTARMLLWDIGIPVPFPRRPVADLPRLLEPQSNVYIYTLLVVGLHGKGDGVVIGNETLLDNLQITHMLLEDVASWVGRVWEHRRIESQGFQHMMLKARCDPVASHIERKHGLQKMLLPLLQFS